MCSIALILIDPIPYIFCIPFAYTVVFDAVLAIAARTSHTHSDGHGFVIFNFENGKWQKLQLKLMKRKELEVAAIFCVRFFHQNIENGVKGNR